MPVSVKTCPSMTAQGFGDFVNNVGAAAVPSRPSRMGWRAAAQVSGDR